MSNARWGLATAAVLTPGTALLLFAGSRGVELANVLALPVGIVGTGAGVAGLLRSRASSGTDRDVALGVEARKLALAVRKGELGALFQLLRPLAVAGDEPAELLFPTRWVEWKPGGRPPGPVRAGGVSLLAATNRLVVLGEPGVGKTVLAMRLVCELAGDAATAVEHREIAVPVRLSLTGLTLIASNEKVADVPGATLANRFDDWLVRAVVEQGVAKRNARALVEDGWVVGVLDGLDEIDQDEAAAVIRALNEPVATPSGLRPVVLTSHVDRYEKLIQAGAASGDSRPIWVEGARVVKLLSFGQDDVIAELTGRFSGDRERWEPVVNSLATSVQDDALVRTLCSPLRLYLAVNIYRPSNTDPAELTLIDSTDDLDAHLFAQLIPAVTRQRARPGGGYYTAGDVQRWLRWLARDRHGSCDPSDLDIADLWASVAPRTCRWLTTGVAVAVTLLLEVAAFRVLSRGPQSPPAPDRAMGALTVLVGGFALMCPFDAARVDLRLLRSRAAGRRLVRGALEGLLIGVALGLLSAAVTSLRRHIPATGVIVAANIGVCTFALLLLGLIAAFDWSPPSTGPRSLVRQGMAFVAMAVLACAGLAALAFALIDINLVPWGTVLGLLLGVGIASGSTWARYAASGLLLACCGRLRPLPVRRAAFLEWGCSVGLLRRAGNAVQFRHSELQEWLSSGPES